MRRTLAWVSVYALTLAWAGMQLVTHFQTLLVR